MECWPTTAETEMFLLLPIAQEARFRLSKREAQNEAEHRDEDHRREHPVRHEGALIVENQEAEIQFMECSTAQGSLCP